MDEKTLQDILDLYQRKFGDTKMNLDAGMIDIKQVRQTRETLRTLSKCIALFVKLLEHKKGIHKYNGDELLNE